VRLSGIRKDVISCHSEFPGVTADIICLIVNV